MRKNLFILSLLSLLANDKVMCQSSTPEKHHEIRIIFTHQKTFYDSDILDEGGLNTKGKSFGAIVNLPITKGPLNLKSGLVFSRQGQEFWTENVNYSPFYQIGLGYHNVCFDLAYVKIPLHLTLTGNKNKQRLLYPYVSIGSQFSFLTKAEYIVDSRAEDIKEDMKNITFDFILSLGLDIRISNHCFIGIGYRYDNTMTSAEKKSLYTSINNSSISSRELAAYNATSGISISIGYFWCRVGKGEFHP